jgi:hypothetical protein
MDTEPPPSPSPERPLEGGCLCGAVRYRITMPFLSSSYCHCTRCQRRTGTGASANARVPREGWELLQGEQELRTFQPPDGAPKVFCSRCGSAVLSGTLQDDQPLGIRLGGLDGDPGIRPSYRHHVATAAVWEPIPDDGLPRHADRPQ